MELQFGSAGGRALLLLHHLLFFLLLLFGVLFRILLGRLGTVPAAILTFTVRVIKETKSFLKTDSLCWPSLLESS